jgi:hypothetical protein
MTGQNPAETTEQTEQAEPTAPQEQTEQPPAEQAEPTAPTAPAPQAPAGNTVNRHKYEREMAAKDARIAELEAENKGYQSVRDDLEAYKKQQETKETESALKKAGCHDVVAASARLGEFDNDVEKLKEAAPYLFSSTGSSKSTSGTQKGAPDTEDARTKKMREYMGLTDKE